MANFSSLKTAVAEVIKTNGNGEITGALLQNVLTSIISTVGKYASFAGVASPTTNPGGPDQNVFWISTEPGIYSNFGGQQVLPGSIVIFSNNLNGSWTASTLSLAEEVGDMLLEPVLGSYIIGIETDFEFTNARLTAFVNSTNTANSQIITLYFTVGGNDIKFVHIAGTGAISDANEIITIARSDAGVNRTVKVAVRWGGREVYLPEINYAVNTTKVVTNVSLAEEVHANTNKTRGNETVAIFATDASFSASAGPALDTVYIKDFGKTADIDLSKEYYIKYLRKTQSLIQIVDADGNKIATYFNPDKTLSGISSVDIEGKFKILADWDSMPSYTYPFNIHINKYRVFLSDTIQIPILSDKIGDIEIATEEIKIKAESAEEKTDYIASVLNHSNTYTLGPSDYVGIAWLSGAVSASVNIWDAAVFKADSRFRYNIQPVANSIKMFASYPKIGDTDGVNWDESLIESRPYILVTINTRDYPTVWYTKTLNTTADAMIRPLSNKKVVFFGDSQVQFKDENNKGCVEYFSEITGAIAVAGGIGGTTLSGLPQSSNPTSRAQAYANLSIPHMVYAWANNNWALVNAAVDFIKNNFSDNYSNIVASLQNIPIESTDVVIIFGGGNNADDGNFGEPGNGDIQTVAGGIDYIIQTLLTKKPELSIYVFNPPPRVRGTLQDPDTPVWSDDYRAGTPESFPNLAKLIIDTAVSNHVPAGDIYNGLGITKYNIQTYYGGGTDSIHLKPAYPKIARFMSSFINSHQNWK